MQRLAYTPKLPVRYTKKVFKDTSSAADPTLSNAAIFFVCFGCGCAAHLCRLDYPVVRTRLPIRTLHAGINGKEL